MIYLLILTGSAAFFALVISTGNTNKDSDIEDIYYPEIQTYSANVRESAVVSYVIDGDTVELSNGDRVRYIGVDAPEAGFEDTGKECYSDESTEANAQLVYGRTITLERDITDRDKYRRLLRYVYLDGKMVNEYLVQLGFARAVSYPPDMKYDAALKDAQNSARRGKFGIWSRCRD